MLTYPGYRGHNLTIIGAIGGNRDHDHLVWSYQVVPTTNTQHVLSYLDKLLEDAGVPENQITIVWDNHGAHTSLDTRARMTQLQCDFIYLPPYSCVLNPCEHMWAAVKKHFAKRVQEFGLDFPADEFEPSVAFCCRQAGQGATMDILHSHDKYMAKIDNGEFV